MWGGDRGKPGLLSTTFRYVRCRVRPHGTRVSPRVCHHCRVRSVSSLKNNLWDDYTGGSTLGAKNEFVEKGKTTWGEPHTPVVPLHTYESKTGQKVFYLPENPTYGTARGGAWPAGLGAGQRPPPGPLAWGGPEGGGAGPLAGGRARGGG